MAIIAASILDANWNELEKEIRSVDKAGVDVFSLDIMDGSFVSRESFDASVAAKIRQYTDLPIEAHLMVSEPIKKVDAFCDAGADQVLFHIETTDKPEALAQHLHSRGVCAGVALLIETDLSSISDELLCSVETINLMAVPVGYGGQKPREDILLDKIKKLRQRIQAVNPAVAIEIDGGMKPYNCKAYVEAGIDIVVMGTGIYHAENYSEAIATAHGNMYHDDEAALKRLSRFLSKNK